MVKPLTLTQQKEATKVALAELAQAAEVYLELYRRQQGGEEVEAELDVQVSVIKAKAKSAEHSLEAELDFDQ